MPTPWKVRWPVLTAVLSALLAGVGVWGYMTWAGNQGGPPSNAIMVVAPYWYNGTWVFDDPAVGLRREPFVAGIPEMIDVLVKDVDDAKNGFRLLFSGRPFPGHQKKLTWLRGSSEGNYYKLDDPPMEGWICPAMFRYYKTPPEALYVKAEPLRR
ncbi:DUF6717 family protein [Paludisphaera rhizosphaerae]|uniref:DUF6717 family protein n=1 Tax=Paludisphaera rhizosphaerae TaxID=2711216 RepID=UPI0019802273|nr:DUF6717 family protein [Paludisphaera rhizosphaerae]